MKRCPKCWRKYEDDKKTCENLGCMFPIPGSEMIVRAAIDKKPDETAHEYHLRYLIKVGLVPDLPLTDNPQS